MYNIYSSINFISLPKRNREVLLLTVAFSLSQGVLGVWLGVMNVTMEMNTNLESIGLNQVTLKTRNFLLPYFQSSILLRCKVDG